jgi:hypothetical protein
VLISGRARPRIHPNRGSTQIQREHCAVWAICIKGEKIRSFVDQIRKLATNQRRIKDFAGKKRPAPLKFGYSVETAQLPRSLQAWTGEPTTARVPVSPLPQF